MVDDKLDNSPELEWMVQSSQVDDALLDSALRERYEHDLTQFAFFTLKKLPPAVEAARRAVSRAVANRHRYTGEIRLKTWLFALTYQQVRRGWVSRLFTSKAETQVELPALPPAEHTSKEAAWIWEGLSALTGRQRLVMLLCYAYDLAPIEAAVILETSRKQIHTRLDQARQGLEHAMNTHSGQDRDSYESGEHLEIRSQCRQASTGRLDLTQLAGLDVHLSGCESCRGYMAEQRAFEAALVRWIRVLWSPVQVENTGSTEVEETPQLSSRTRLESVFRRRRFSVKEAAFSLLLVSVLSGMSWMGFELSTKPKAAAAVKPPTMVVISHVTRTPEVIYVVAEPTPTVSRRSAPQPTAALPERGGSSHILEFPEYERFTSLTEGVNPWASSGPVALSAVLRYWESEVSLAEVLQALQPNPLDETVMPYELDDFIDEKVSASARQQMKSLYRLGGDMELLQKMIKAGFPVIVQAGFEDPGGEGWFAHYQVVQGYDGRKANIQLLALAADESSANTLNYAEFLRGWQAFSYAFYLVYPASQEKSLRTVLGSYMSMDYSAEQAANLASREIFSSSGTALFFAWFNRGTSLAYLDDYHGAAKAYDEAFSLLSQFTSTNRPDRILWYQTRPYWAYYYTNRYQDLIDLTTNVITSKESPVLEESLYWRGLAKEAQGDIQGAIKDLRQSLQVNPNFIAGQVQLERLEAGL